MGNLWYSPFQGWIILSLDDLSKGWATSCHDQRTGLGGTGYEKGGSPT